MTNNNYKTEKKKEVFTIWNWFILIASGVFMVFYIIMPLLSGEYMGLIIGFLFLIGFISIYGKFKRSKEE